MNRLLNGVAIAAVLALGPRILLLDEPLAGLGPEEAREITALITNLKRDCAIMLIEHDIDVVFSVADCITVLDNGRVIASGSPERVRASAEVQRAADFVTGSNGDDGFANAIERFILGGGRSHARLEAAKAGDRAW